MFGDLSNSSDLMIETYKEDPEGSTQKVISTDDSFNNHSQDLLFRAFLSRVNPEYLKVVPDHWLDLELPTSEIQVFMSIYLLMLCIPGNLSQIVVMVAYLRAPKLHTASNRLLISLLSADFIILLCCYIAAIQGLMESPVFGVFGCEAYGFWSTVGALAEIWSLAAVSRDRYNAVFYPFNDAKRMTRPQANMIIFSIWGLATLFATFPLIGWSKFVSESFYMGCTFDCFTATWNSRSYLITLLIVAWVIPLIVILNSHLRIIMYLRTANIQSLFISNLPCRSRLHSNDVRHNDQGLDQEESSCGDNKCFPHVTQRLLMEEKLSKMVTTLLLVWFAAWTPYAAMSLWIMIDASYLSPGLGLIPIMACKTSAGANAMLYGLRLPKFKTEVQKMLIAHLPSGISGFFRTTHSEKWRSDQQNPDIFLSNGASRTCQNRHENRNIEGINELIGFVACAQRPSAISSHGSGLISSKSCHELTYRTDIRLDTYRFSVSYTELSVLRSFSNTIKRHSSSIKVTKGKECISLSKEKIPLLLEDDKANSLNSGRKEKVVLNLLKPWKSCFLMHALAEKTSQNTVISPIRRRSQSDIKMHFTTQAITQISYYHDCEDKNVNFV